MWLLVASCRLLSALAASNQQLGTSNTYYQCPARTAATMSLICSLTRAGASSGTLCPVGASMRFDRVERDAISSFIALHRAFQAANVSSDQPSGFDRFVAVMTTSGTPIR